MGLLGAVEGVCNLLLTPNTLRTTLYFLYIFKYEFIFTSNKEARKWQRFHVNWEGCEITLWSIVGGLLFMLKTNIGHIIDITYVSILLTSVGAVCVQCRQCKPFSYSNTEQTTDGPKMDTQNVSSWRWKRDKTEVKWTYLMGIWWWWYYVYLCVR